MQRHKFATRLADAWRGTLLPIFYRSRASAINWLIRLQHHLGAKAQRRATSIEIVAWIAIVLGGALIAPYLRDWLTPISTTDQMTSLRNVVGMVGAAMIGATAIVTSFILFTMQVNVERLPHSLFLRFSTDRMLLAIFGLSFAVSVAGTSLTLIAHQQYFATLVMLALFSLSLVLRLLLLGCQRRWDSRPVWRSKSRPVSVSA